MGSSRVQVKCPKCSEIFLPTVEETQSRAGASSRRKGHTFERKVAKLLQDWWNSNRDATNKCEFKRSPQSGGSALKVGFQMHGDVVCNASNWHYSLEAKNAPGSFAGLHQFLSADKFAMWGWLEQAEDDCPLGKRALLVVNRFDQPTWCIMRKTDFVNDALLKAKFSFFTLVSITHTTVLYIWKLDDMLASNPEIWV